MEKNYDVRINTCRRTRINNGRVSDGTVIAISIHDYKKFNLPERAIFVEEDDRLYFYPSDKGYKLSGGNKYQLGRDMVEMFEQYQGTAFLHFDEEAGMYFIVRSEVIYDKEYRKSHQYSTRCSKPKKEDTEDMAVVKVKPKETENFVVGVKEEWLNNVCATCKNYDICKYAQSVDELRVSFNNLPDVNDFLTIKVECKYRR